MATQIQNRRGTTAGHATFTGAAGELTVDTDLNVAVIHDGSTAGGFPLLNATAAQTLSNKTLTSAVLNTGVSGTAVKDEDDMSSDSATHLATQQSIKAYVDSQVTAQDLDFAADSGGSLAIDLDSEALTIAGGTGLTTAGATNTVTVTLDDTAVSAGSYGSGTAIPNITIDAQGRITSASTSAVSSDMAIGADSGSGGPITVGTDTFTVSGGTGIETAVSGDTITVNSTLLDVTAGTATASKALVVDANKDLTLGTGDFTCTDCTVTGTLTETSAAMYKENISPLAGQLDNIMQLNPVEYDKKTSGKHEYGLIADEVQAIYPDFVGMKEGHADSLNYSRMVSVLVKAVQELTEKVNELGGK